MLPPLSVPILPCSGFIGDDPVPVGKGIDLLPEESQPVKKMAHPVIPAIWSDPGCRAVIVGTIMGGRINWFIDLDQCPCVI